MAAGCLRRRNGLSSLRLGSRAYHDRSYGYREARPFVLPDCTLILLLIKHD